MTWRCWAVAAACAWLPACSAVGPASLASGRSTYNAVINTTEDEQILSMIVRLRYGESFGMLAVSSVTASLRFSGSVAANAGVGPDSSFEGNLVPLSVGAAYEENPVITYVPLRGEQFVERMLAPISGKQALLLTRMSNDELEVLQLLVRRANGLVNPLYSPTSAEQERAFDRFVELYARLRDEGALDVVGTDDGGYELLVHDWDRYGAEVGEFLHAVGTPDQTAASFTLPLRFYVGARGDSLDLETPSALEVLEAAAFGVEVPSEHGSAALARALPSGAGQSFLRVRCSKDRPGKAAIAVQHRDWWFFIESTDARSKRSFFVLRTLIGLRLDEASAQPAPIVTVPVGG